MGEQRKPADAAPGTLKKPKKKKIKNEKSAKKPSDIVSCIAFLPRGKKKSAGRQFEQLSEEDPSSDSDVGEKGKRKKKMKKKEKGDEADSYDALQNVFNDEKENEKVIKEDNLIETNKKYLFDDELCIEDGDALTLNGKIYSDIGTLEVHLVNYDEGIFNIYDDVIIDDYPLCLEVIGESYYGGRDIVAVGTMKQEIGLWDIHSIDTLEALSYLGGTERAKRGGEGRKKRRKGSGEAAEVGGVEASQVGQADGAAEGAAEGAAQKKGQKRKQSKNNLQGHTECVTCLNSSKVIPNLMCSGSKDCSIKLWDLSNLTYLHSFNFHQKKVNSVSFHANESNILLSTSSDKRLKLYDIRKDTVGMSIHLESTPESTTWSKFNEKEIISSDVDGYVSRIDIRYATDSSSSFSHKSTVRFKAFSNSCVSLVSTHYPNLTLAGSEDGLVKVYDFGAFGEAGPPCLYTKDLKRNLYCMKENEDWPNVIFFGCDKLYDWDFKSCKELREYLKL
ncbi:periodic tryptophan protein 1, putative [Plasmodium vivax]|uniref:Periodic tryptophan protein 1, putative n=1 Tax=Plasmodium vivax TaxID=5855 RepID=A0A1G4HLA9_PLAVI|nr:periodic tryptophan protein 1, putative [Plasmodium vivax]